MSSGRTRVLSVHRNRENARQVERDVQAILDSGSTRGGQWRYAKHDIQVPGWASSVRVERVGYFAKAGSGWPRKLGVQWTVVAVE